MWGALLLTLAASAGVAIWAPEEEPAPVVAAARPAGAPPAVRPPHGPVHAAATPGAEPRTTGRAQPPAPSQAEANPFPPRSAWPPASPAALAAWGQAPAAAPPAPAPPVAEGPPPAPKFPYAFIGRLDDTPADTLTGTTASTTTVLLGGPQRSLGVRVGEVLDGQWRVDRITRSALHLTWLPGGQAVQLSLR
ncbi:MAG: hypothetical protein ACK5QH_17310 [Rubrivivax sp.]